MINLNKSALFEPTLTHRHFRESGIPRYQLHEWMKRIGFGGEQAEKRGWLRQSPANVFQFCVLKRLKEKSQLWFSSNAAFLDFLSEEATYTKALHQFIGGEKPYLMTDLEAHSEIVPDRTFGAKTTLDQADFWIVFSLVRPLLISIAATLRGGSKDQKYVVRDLVTKSDAILYPSEGHRKSGRKVRLLTADTVSDVEILKQVEEALA